MSTYQIKRWDAVIFGNDNSQSPMFYVTPDMYLLEFFKANQYSVFCEVRGSGSVYDGMIIPGVVNQSAYTPNCRPNYFEDTNTYVVTLNMDFKGYPNRNGSVIFSGYKNPKPQVKPSPNTPSVPMPKRVIPSIHSNKIPIDSVGLPVTQYCENGQTFQCALGTYGCTYNSERFCPQIENSNNGSPAANPSGNGSPAANPSGGGGTGGGGTGGGGTTQYTPGRYGSTETHRCTYTPTKKGGGSTFECQGGTEGCYDDSHMYCQNINTRLHDCGNDLKIDCDTKYTDDECQQKFC